MFENSILKPLTKEFVKEISNWEYESPYEAYSFKGHPTDWLMDEATWGTEQFCLITGHTERMLLRVAAWNKRAI